MYIVESECIYCGACVIECPEGAVVSQTNGSQMVIGEQSQEGIAINSDICTECPDQDLPMCYSICPMNCIKLND